MFYEGLSLWEAHLYVFYVSGRLSGGRMSNGLVAPGGSAKERPSRAGRGGEGGEARFVVFYEGLRPWGGSGSNGVKGPGGSAKERPSRAWGEGEGERGSYEFK